MGVILSISLDSCERVTDLLRPLQGGKWTVLGHSDLPPKAKPPQLYSCGGFVILFIVERYCFYQELIRFGDDLLSHVLRRSTIGATALNGWVRDGTRCFARAMITKPNKFLIKRSAQQSDGGRQGIRRMPIPAPSPLERKACFCPSHVPLIVCVCF